MKKIFVYLMMLMVIISLTGCKRESDAIRFKKDYESINGKENSHGKINREISISEDNVFVISNANEILEKLNNKDSFYVYFGSKLCPWCRSVIEKANEMAIERGVAKIYYVDIWDDEGNEILRDKYTLDDDNKPFLEKEGTSEYQKLLEAFDYLLKEYTLKDKDNYEINVGEKRIFAPNFIHIDKGIPKKLVTGISDKQKDSR